MAEYIVITDKPIKLDAIMHLHGINHYSVKRLKNHGRIVDLDKVLDWLINEKRAFSMEMSAKVDNALSDAPVIMKASE